MKRIFLPLFLTLIMLMVINAHASVPTTGSQLFFDDFTGSQYPSQWVGPVAQSYGNVSQVGGFLVLTVSRYATQGAIFRESGLYANQSNIPIISSTTGDGQFIYMAWKIYPFNMTLASPNIGRIGELQFGFTSQGLFTPGQVTSSIYFDLMTQDFPKNSYMTLYPNEKQAISLAVAGPNPNAANCFDSAVILAAVTCNKPIIQYTGTSSPQFDLGAGHIFSMEMKLYPVTHKSWIAFFVDGGAMMNVTQGACSCIDGAGNYLSMYPFIHLAYTSCVTLNGGAGTGCPLTTQSLASAVDWVLVDNFVPSSLPPGSVISCNLTGLCFVPATLPQPGVTGTLSDFLVFEANSIAPGNVFAGGMILMGMISGLLFIGMGLAARKIGVGFKPFGFYYTIAVLGLSFLGLFTGILPIWVPVMTTIITIGIVFGVIRTGGSSGGVVPD